MSIAQNPATNPISVSIPKNETDLRNWLNTIKEHCDTPEAFNAKLVSMLKTYFHLVQNIEWTVFDKSIEERWDHFESKFQGNLEGLTDKLNQKIELFQVQLQESVSKPIQSEFQKLQTSIDVFRGDSMVSSKKGKIGEMQVERQIEDYFPDAEITDKSKQPHQTDYHLKLVNKYLPDLKNTEITGEGGGSITIKVTEYGSSDDD